MNNENPNISFMQMQDYIVYSNQNKQQSQQQQENQQYQQNQQIEQQFQIGITQDQSNDLLQNYRYSAVEQLMILQYREVDENNKMAEQLFCLGLSLGIFFTLILAYVK